MTAITTEHLSKRYRNGVTALDDLTLQVREGEIFSLLGPNGAGKSTLISILTACSAPTAGTAAVCGFDVRREAGRLRARTACAAQRVSIDAHLTLEENMLFQARLYRVKSGEAKTRMRELIRLFGLEESARRPARTCSGGIQRRLDIAVRMISRPGVLFLDEPTAGMDVNSRQALWELIRGIRERYGTTVFLTTHYLEEAEQLSDTVCILQAGRLLAQGAPAELGRSLARDLIRIAFDTPAEARRCAQELGRTGMLESVRARGGEVLAAPGGRDSLRGACAWLLERRMPFSGISASRPSLEEIFLALTREGGAGI